MTADWQYPRSRLLVFCKAPVAGQVKTRLIPALGSQGAADLHRQLASNVFALCRQQQLAPVELWCAGDAGDDFFVDSGLVCRSQQGADLGQRMAQALAESLAGDAVDAAILIGTDCINLDTSYLAAALDALQGHEAVLGPAEDGGYGLIGLRQPSSSVFADIQWGSDQVCAATARHFNREFERWALLPLLWDLDRPEDLVRYRTR